MATLLLSDGGKFEGTLTGAPIARAGVLAVHTTMGGYMDVLTSPEYAGMMVCFTFPVIGAAGVFAEGAAKPSLNGVIARSLSDVGSNWKSEGRIADYLAEKWIPAIVGVDTRALARRVRGSGGIIAAGICPDAVSEEVVLKMMEQTVIPFEFPLAVKASKVFHAENERARAAIFDTGCSRSAVDALNRRSVSAQLLPPETVLSGQADFSALVIPAGPDAIAPREMLDMINTSAEKGIPILAVGAASTWTAEALGAKTSALPSAHRGDNIPVTCLGSGKTAITAQSHTRVPEIDGVSGFVATHRNLNDKTVEGFRLKNRPVFAVQYAPTVDDAIWDEFVSAL